MNQKTFHGPPGRNPWTPLWESLPYMDWWSCSQLKSDVVNVSGKGSLSNVLVFIDYVSEKSCADIKCQSQQEDESLNWVVFPFNSCKGAAGHYSSLNVMFWTCKFIPLCITHIHTHTHTLSISWSCSHMMSLAHTHTHTHTPVSGSLSGFSAWKERGAVTLCVREESDSAGTKFYDLPLFSQRSDRTA